MSGLTGLSLAPDAIRYRLKLLAVIIVSVAIAAYAGPGLASGGSENMDANETASVEQYDGKGRADKDSDSSTGQNASEEDSATSQTSRTKAGFSPSVPFSYESFNKDISVVGDDPAPSVTKARAGERAVEADDAEASAADTEGFAEPSIPVVAVAEDMAAEADARPQASSVPATPVSYNAETYCRTYERGASVSASTKSRAVFPLPEDYFDSYDDTWGAARPQGGHEGTDMMSPAGTPEYAITDGTVVRVAGSNGNGWNYLGGYTVMIRADNGIGPVKKGDLFYYAHMQRESVLPIGTEVEAGEQVGVVGDTGYGSEGTRGQFPPHLHLGWYDMTGTTAEAPSGAMNPYPLLEWLKRNGGTASGGWGPERASQGYCDYQERVAAEPPASDESDDHDHDLPPGASSGSSADLDTGSADPSPSPVVKRQIRRSQSESRATASTSESDHGSSRDLPRASESVADSRQVRNSRPAPEPPSEGGRDNEDARGVDTDGKRSDRPSRTPERKKKPDTTPPSASPAPQQPDQPVKPVNPGKQPKDDVKQPRPAPDKPEPDKPEPDKPEPDKPEPDKPEPDKPEPDKPEPDKPEPDKPEPDKPEPDKLEPDEDKEPVRRSSILPVAFHDEDADGVRDAGEAKLSGWSVKLRGSGSAGATGETGARIGGLKFGIHRVTVKTEEGHAGTTPNTVRVRVGERREARPSFGFVELSEIDVVVCDSARGGEPCSREGENPRRWDLELRDEKGRWIAEATTGRDGEACFPDLRPGVYELIFAPRAGSSDGEPESKKLNVTGGGVWSVELREKDSQEDRRDEPRDTSVEVSRHPETREEKQ